MARIVANFQAWGTLVRPLLGVTVLVSAASTFADESNDCEMSCELPTADVADSQSAEQPGRDFGSNIHYGKKGLEYISPTTETDLWIGLRFQTRIDSHDGDLVKADDLGADRDTNLELRRGRIKGGGALWREWFEIYSEYDFRSDTLLDYRATATYDNWLSFRIGQWKSEYSRERIDSSGKQQFVERSISNYWFTVDRQQAVGISPHFAKGTAADTRVWLEVLSGQGLGGGIKDDSRLWLGRVQWNPAGKQLPFSQSDLKRRQQPLPSIAVATIVGRSPYTRFSSSGGGSLPGLEQGDYNLRQLLFETAVHYRGLAWQQELHWKEIENRNTGRTIKVVGGYAQLGSFLNEWWPQIPPRLEVTTRVALVDPHNQLSSDKQWELTLGGNWFFNGHRNKLTSDVSWLDFDSPTGQESQWRLRLQWELSI